MKKLINIILIIIAVFISIVIISELKFNNTKTKVNTLEEETKKKVEHIEKEDNKHKKNIEKNKINNEKKDKTINKENTVKKSTYKHNLPLNTKGMNNVNGFIEANTIPNPNILKEVTKESLINKYNWLPNNYVPKELKKINSNIYLQKDAADAYKRLEKDAAKKGIKFVVFSGYRAYSLQKRLYSSAYNKDILDAIQYTAYPGTSEHNAGLSMDISYNYNFPVDFYNTAQGKFLKENAYKYGFILRYPKDKENITNYHYESWHYRYVGKKMAKEIHNRNITLEEYYGTEK